MPLILEAVKGMYTAEGSRQPVAPEAEPDQPVKDITEDQDPDEETEDRQLLRRRWGMCKTWEKTCSGASIIVRNLDFSRWGGPLGCPPGAAGALVPVRPRS